MNLRISEHAYYYHSRYTSPDFDTIRSHCNRNDKGRCKWRGEVLRYERPRSKCTLKLIHHLVQNSYSKREVFSATSLGFSTTQVNLNLFERMITMRYKVVIKQTGKKKDQLKTISENNMHLYTSAFSKNRYHRMNI